MIFVRRPKQAPKEVLDALDRPPAKQTESELMLARRYYAAVPPPTKTYAFEMYREPEVCRWLDRLFHEKCAYCESQYQASKCRNVEHYRPKGGVSGTKPRHKGYWWLANDWRNLVPSCIACNQRRRHAFYRDGMTMDELRDAELQPKGELAKGGKGNIFPMRSPTTWVRSEGALLSDEDPLLIDPMERDPVSHLEWVFDWDRTRFIWHANPLLVVVRPLRSSGVDDPYGRASIDTYSLNRGGLFRTRMEHLARMRATACALQFAMYSEARAQGADLASSREEVVQQKRNFESYVQDDAPFLGMARAFRLEFERELARQAALPRP